MTRALTPRMHSVAMVMCGVLPARPSEDTQQKNLSAAGDQHLGPARLVKWRPCVHSTCGWTITTIYTISVHSSNAERRRGDSCGGRARGARPRRYCKKWTHFLPPPLLGSSTLGRAPLPPQGNPHVNFFGLTKVPLCEFYPEHSEISFETGHRSIPRRSTKSHPTTATPTHHAFCRRLLFRRLGFVQRRHAVAHVAVEGRTLGRRRDGEEVCG